MTRAEQHTLEVDIQKLELAVKKIEVDIQDAMKNINRMKFQTLTPALELKMQQLRSKIREYMRDKQKAVSHLTVLKQVKKSNLEKMGATKKDDEVCAICTQSLFECPENESTQNQKYYDRMKQTCCDKYKCKNYFTNPAAHLRQSNVDITIEDENLPNLPKCNQNLSEPNQCWVTCLANNSKCTAKFHKLCIARYLIIDAPFSRREMNWNSRKKCPTCRKKISQQVKQSLVEFLKNTRYPNSNSLQNRINQNQLTNERRRGNRLWNLGLLGLTGLLAASAGSKLNSDFSHLNVPANRVPCANEGDYLENRAEYCTNYLNQGYTGINSHYNLGIGTWHSINVPTEPGFSHRYFIPSGRVVTDDNGHPISYQVDLTSSNMNPTSCVTGYNGVTTCYGPDGGYNP